MKKNFKTLFVISMVLALNSCALRPIISHYDYQKNKTENVSLENLGNGKILIYNGADGLHKIDNTARLNIIWIDEKTKVIRIEPTITSNDLTIINQLPAKFDKFRYVESR